MLPHGNNNIHVKVPISALNLRPKASLLMVGLILKLSAYITIVCPNVEVFFPLSCARLGAMPRRGINSPGFDYCIDQVRPDWLTGPALSAVPTH